MTYSSAAVIPVTFIFDDGNSTGATGLALEGLSTNAAHTQDGIKLTASTAFGVFNLTNEGFGPDDVTGDDTDSFDGAESMVFSFDTDGTFNSIDFALLGGTGHEGETATLSFAGGSTFDLLDAAFPTSSISASTNDLFEGIDESFTAGQQITLSITAGNGWTLENFTTTAVPEPGSYALLAGFASLGFIMLRRRNR
jgi:hypothetical protein